MPSPEASKNAGSPVTDGASSQLKPGSDGPHTVAVKDLTTEVSELLLKKNPFKALEQLADVWLLLDVHAERLVLEHLGADRPTRQRRQSA